MFITKWSRTKNMTSKIKGGTRNIDIPIPATNVETIDG